MTFRRPIAVWWSLGAVALVGCNLLSGSDEFRFDPNAAAQSAHDDGGADRIPVIASDSGVTAPALVCPRGLANCNGDITDGCEVDTQDDKQNCGRCGTACTVAGSMCVAGKCAPPPPSCKALLAVAPGTPSGSYLLDADGEGARTAFLATCDMETAGGGWTLVFDPTVFENATTALDYTIGDKTLLSTAAETLLAHRDEKNIPIGTTAVFGLPSDWRVRAPFGAKAQDVNVTVWLDGVASSKVLRYGTASFHDLCSDDWVETSSYGRICIAGTSAPYYVGFAVGGLDLCVNSSQSFNLAYCTAQRHFTIGVR